MSLHDRDPEKQVLSLPIYDRTCIVGMHEKLELINRAIELYKEADACIELASNIQVTIEFDT